MKQYISPTFDFYEVSDNDVILSSMAHFGDDWGVDDEFGN
jgi:hypothetical protein